MKFDGINTFASIPALKAACRAADNHFFSKGAMQFFKSKVESAMYGGRYFITSEQFETEPREYRVREVTRDSKTARIDIETVATHTTLQDARADARARARATN